MPVISVIVPVYNAGQTIVRCVESIQNNTYKNLEIILVEDGSADDSGEICNKLAVRFDNVTALKNDRNRGVSYSRNRGLEAASGRYIMFADSDDWLERDYYASFIRVLQVNPKALIVCGFINHDEKYQGRKDERTWSGTGESFTVSRLVSLQALYDKGLILQLWNKVFSAEVIRENGIRFDESISIGEDFRFVLSYLQHINEDTITILDRPLYHYMRDQEGALMYHVGYESIEEPLKNLRLLYKLEGCSGDEIERKLIAARETQLQNYAYIIMRSAAFSAAEKKRLIIGLDSSKGNKLYKEQVILKVKEQVAVKLKRSKWLRDK